MRALVVIDMLNTYEFDSAEALIANVERALPRMRALMERAEHAGKPIIYVNDNFGTWNHDRDGLVKRVLEGEHRAVIEPIVPKDDVLFVAKARHSIFYETPLEYLIRSEGIDELVLTGQVTEQCILYSALDAHIRHIPVVVPRDACAHIDEDLAKASFAMMERNMSATVCTAEEVEF